MKVGDLIMFRRCSQQGKLGIISIVPKQSHLAKSKPELRIYWVFSSIGAQCYTGSQLELINDR